MKKSTKKKVFYYKDELNDEFSGITRNTIVIDKNYKYIRKNFLYKFIAFVIYRVIVMPFAYFYMKIKFHMKVENKKILQSAKKESYFMYGNHTQLPGDGFIPNILNYPNPTSRKPLLQGFSFLTNGQAPVGMPYGSANVSKRHNHVHTQFSYGSKLHL